VIAFRTAHPVFRRRRWFQGRLIRGIDDLAWLRPDGDEMTDDDWSNGYARAIGVFLNGTVIPTTDTYGEPIVDDSFLVLFNAGHESIDWRIPGPTWGRRWTVDLDTEDPRKGATRTANARHGSTIEVHGRSIVVLRSTQAPAAPKRRPETAARPVAEPAVTTADVTSVRSDDAPGSDADGPSDTTKESATT
jgi:glycogen operon protein